MPELDLYGKTEVWIVGVRLERVRLPELSAAAATALDLDAADVFVTDVRDRHVVIDVLSPRVDLASIAGRAQALLDRLASVDGVTVLPDATVHSNGVLGVLGAPAEQADELVRAADQLADGLRRYVARRVAVVSTGAEVDDHRVEDTNFQVIDELMSGAGYDVSHVGVVLDDDHAIAGRVLRCCVDDGFGIVVTTGGVGAEDKDRTIEAIELLDPNLSTAVLATYQAGHGRHVKSHVRVAVANVGDALVIALPGPTREVECGITALISGLTRGHAASVLVEEIAASIRALWPGGHTTKEHTR
jgi:molybdopterin biosynthesis enzyme MoaB